MLAGLDEPVRRYFRHAIADGAPTGAAVGLRMTGRIRVGRWLPFTAAQRIDARSFTWRARVGLGRLTLLRVVDGYADGAGEMEIRLFGRLRVMRSTGRDVSRAAAGRAALEIVAWAPSCALPGDGVAWRAEADDHIVASIELPPERVEVHVRIDERGAVRTIGGERWRSTGRRAFGYVPFGGHVLDEARFGGLTVPSRLSVGWWFGTPQFSPFFEATVTGLGLLQPAAAPGTVSARGGAGLREGLGGLGVMARALATPHRRAERQSWGLDAATAARELPGDDLVPAPRWTWTHGIEVAAPADEVWPWVAQIGADRAGFYSYEWLENLVGCRVRNADRVHPEWQLRLGDGLLLHPRQPALPVVRLAPGEHLVAYLAGEDARGAGRSWAAASWLLLVEPLGPRRSRVISRCRFDYSDDLPTRMGVGPALMEPIGFAMDRRMVLGLRERVEGSA